MRQLIALAKKKPHWLTNEGYWRILQILRMVAFVPLALSGIVTLGAAIVENSYHSKDMFGISLFFLALSVVSFVAVHGIAWMITWVIAGFSETKKS